MDYAVFYLFICVKVHYAGYMAAFVGTGSSSPHSLRTRWTPLDTRLTGRCVEEHQHLMAALQRAMTNAGTFTTLASNAKIRGLVDAIVARRHVILEFIVHHRTVHGDADAQQICAFEALLERLSSAEQRALEWDGSRHLMITPGGSVISHRRPMVSSAANAMCATRSPAAQGGTRPKSAALIATPSHPASTLREAIEHPTTDHVGPLHSAFTPK
jgi:hypothetical protein